MTDDREATTIARVAERFRAALEAGDLDEMERLYAADAVIWHNGDAIEMTLAEQITSFRNTTSYLVGLRYVDVRLSIFPGGFVQQHRCTATTREGRALDLPGCIVCRVAAERITRLDEYFDPAALGKVGLRPIRPDRAPTF